MANYRERLNGKTWIAAHRGIAGGDIPCNSIAGYEAALLQGADVETIAVRMEDFLRTLTVSVLLIAPPPLQRGAWVGEDSLVVSSRLLGERYRALAERLQIPFADSGSWGIALTFDGVHFSEAGHHVFADHLISMLK